VGIVSLQAQLRDFSLAARFASSPDLNIFAPLTFFAPLCATVKNGRLAMIAVLGELMAQQVSGMGTYEQLSVIVNDLPLPF